MITKNSTFEKKITMNKIITSILMLCATVAISFAQPTKRYLMTYTTGSTYAPLSSTATDVGFPIDWDDEFSDDITMPFPFKYQNVPVTILNIETYGSIFLNQTPTMFDMGHIAGINCDYESKNRGKIYYETVGTTGNRIFKVEYRNVGFYSDTLGTDTANFQIWLYEQDNAIEYRAGYSSISNIEFMQTLNDLMLDKEFLIAGLLNNPGDSIASDDTTVTFMHSAVLNGSSLMDYQTLVSDLMQDENLTVQTLLKQFPPNGSIIRMVPNVPSSIADHNNELAAIFPNPSSDGIFTVNVKNAIKEKAAIAVYNAVGKLVYSGNLLNNNAQINIAKEPAGTYFCRIINGEQKGIFEIIKK